MMKNIVRKLSVLSITALLAVPTLVQAATGDIKLTEAYQDKALVSWNGVEQLEEGGYDVVLTSFDGTRILFSDENTYERDLRFTNLKPFTKYKLTVTGADGTETFVFKTKAIVPERPEVKVSDLTTNTAYISWVSKNISYSPHTVYNVKIKDVSNDKIVQELNTGELNKKIYNLKPDTSYYAIVTCEKDNEKSLEEYKYFTTAALIPQVQVSDVTATDAYVSWGDSGMEFSPDAKFHVVIENAATGEIAYEKITSDLNIKVDGLKPNSGYEAIVTCGGDSRPVWFYTPEALPEDFTISADKTAEGVTITWDFDFNAWCYEVYVDGEMLDYVFSDSVTIKYTEGMNIQVKACNSAGSGVSNIVVVK